MARSASASATSAPACGFRGLLEAARTSIPARRPTAPVHHGGPVEPGRGFVLHSTDWGGQDTLQVNGADGELCAMTGTIDVLKAIAEGRGPSQWIVALGYAGWGEGQLEEEMTRHGWFAADGRPAILFDTPTDERWAAAFKARRHRPAPAVERDRRGLSRQSTYKEFFIFALARAARLGAARDARRQRASPL